MQSLSILIRSLAIPFYKSNIGLFLVILFISFGLMRAIEHIALASSIAVDLTLTLITLVLWLSYWLYAFSFTYKQINTRSYTFLRTLILCNQKSQFTWLFVVFLIIGIPIWSYAIFISTFNFTHKTYGLLTLMMGFMLSANTAIAIITLNLLKKPIKEIEPGLWYKYISKYLTLPFYLWFIRHVFVNETMLIFLTKSASLIILIGTFYLFETDVYDWRLIGIGTLFAISTNGMLVYNYYEFYQDNKWIYNLPRKRAAIILSSLSAIVLLFIPEMILIGINASQHISIIHWGGLLLLTISLGYLIFCLLIHFSIPKEQFTKRLFYFMVAMIFVIMYGIPLLFVNLVLFSLSLIIIRNFYNTIS